MNLPPSLLPPQLARLTDLTKVSRLLEVIVHAPAGFRPDPWRPPFPFGQRMWIDRQLFDGMVDRYGFKVTVLREADEASE